MKRTHWDHRSVCWGGDLTPCQCAPPITPAGVTPSATTPQTQELLCPAHELQHPPSRLDLAREATSTWQDGLLQEGPYNVHEGVCAFQHSAFDLSNDLSISSHSP